MAARVRRLCLATPVKHLCCCHFLYCTLQQQLSPPSATAHGGTPPPTSGLLPHSASALARVHAGRAPMHEAVFRGHAVCLSTCSPKLMASLQGQLPNATAFARMTNAPSANLHIRHMHSPARQGAKPSLPSQSPSPSPVLRFEDHAVIFKGTSSFQVRSTQS